MRLKCALTLHIALLGALLHAGAVEALNTPAKGPEATQRSHASNYKDMVLARCLAAAYRDTPAAGEDAGSSSTALREWTRYDMEKAPSELKSLVDNYLQRDYTNPIAAAEGRADVKFSLLKCLDLYHSKDLDDQVKRLVTRPRQSYRQLHRARK